MILPLISVLITAPNPISVDSLVADFQKENPSVGLSVSVRKSGKPLHEKGYGWQDKESKIPASNQTIYRLGSISKSVTAVATMQLVESGKLDLKTSISTYIPEWKSTKPKITLEQLLSHTSGVRHYMAGRRDNTTNHYTTTSEALNLFINDNLHFPPGEDYKYSTHAYTLVARAIETASNQSFAEYLNTSIFKKLGKSTLSLEDLSKPVPKNRASLYNVFGSTGAVIKAKTPEDNSWKYGGGGMESSAPDLAKFGEAVLNGTLLKAETLNRMWTAPKFSKNQSYALGWAMPSKQTFGHGGAQQGCRTMLIIHPKTKTVVVAMSNLGGPGLDNLAGQILELYAPGATHKSK